ncbi:unnamed protein product [Cunninghamella echinulata]
MIEIRYIQIHGSLRDLLSYIDFINDLLNVLNAFYGQYISANNEERNIMLSRKKPSTCTSVLQRVLEPNRDRNRKN